MEAPCWEHGTFSKLQFELKGGGAALLLPDGPGYMILAGSPGVHCLQPPPGLLRIHHCVGCLPLQSVPVQLSLTLGTVLSMSQLFLFCVEKNVTCLPRAPGVGWGWGFFLMLCQSVSSVSGPCFLSQEVWVMFSVVQALLPI